MQKIHSNTITRISLLRISLFRLIAFGVVIAVLAIFLVSAANTGWAVSDSNSSEESNYDTDNTEQSDAEFVETVIMTGNLFADAKIAKQKQVPILLLFTQQSCGYCEIVRSDFLRPMLLNRDYDNRVLIRQIEYDGDDVIGFDGKKISMDSFMEPYNIGFTPTVIFLDATGKELTEQIIGITTVHYYGGFIDDNIELALKKIRTANNKLATK